MIIEFKDIDRKSLANAIGKIVGKPAIYQYVPTYAYKIGELYTIDKNGNLITDENVDRLLSELEKKGFHTKNKLTVEIPKLEDDVIEKLKKLIENKGELFKLAFKTDSLEIKITDEKVCFPWFTLETDEDGTAYSNFVYLLCEFVKGQSRVNNKPETTDNPKYTMRCFLIRIGVIGKDYKNMRKVILRNLSGSSAFRKVGLKDEVFE